MPIAYACPFFRWEENSKTFSVSCSSRSCAKVKFASKDERDGYVGDYCANNPGWTDCTLAQKFFEEADNDGKG